MKFSLGMFNVILLGLTFMLVFTAFQTGGLIQPTVLASIHNETNGEYNGNGYISFAIVYAVFAVANWIAPSIIALINPRMAMLVGAVMYNIFISQFLYPIEAGLYVASALVGFGAAIIWTAQGTFLTQNSTKETMSRNSGIFWAMMQFSLIWGNVFVYFAFAGKKMIDHDTRTLVYGVLTAVGVGGNLIMFLFRKPPRDENQEENDEKPPFIKGIVDSFALLKTPNMMMLSVAFIYTGLELSFFSVVYGSAVGFTKKFAQDSSKYVAICGLLIGIGEVASGLAFSIFDEHTKRLGRGRIVLLGFISHLIAFILAFINLPADSPHRATHDEGFIHPSLPVAFFCSILLGFGDGCFNTQIYSLIGSVYSENSSSAFSLFKFMQSIAAAAFFVVCAQLDLPPQLGVLLVSAILGTGCFIAVARRVANEDEAGNSEKGRELKANEGTSFGC